MVVITTSLSTQLSIMVLPGKNYFPVQISAVITETNPALTRVGASLDWNDGSPPITFAPGLPLTISATRNLPIGTYFIALTGYNYLQPAPQKTAMYFTVQVMPPAMVPVPNTYLFGPILPMDNGYPNQDQWNFNVGTNLDVLKSSVKMLLLTTKGERIMEPTYGTYLRRAVFEPNTGSVTSIVRQEIDEALNVFEPRVTLDALNVQSSPNTRSALVTATFLSKLNQSTFSLALPFSQ